MTWALSQSILACSHVPHLTTAAPRAGCLLVVGADLGTVRGTALPTGSQQHNLSCDSTITSRPYSVFPKEGGKLTPTEPTHHAPRILIMRKLIEIQSTLGYRLHKTAWMAKMQRLGHPPASTIGKQGVDSAGWVVHREKEESGHSHHCSLICHMWVSYVCIRPTFTMVLSNQVSMTNVPNTLSMFFLF